MSRQRAAVVAALLALAATILVLPLGGPATAESTDTAVTVHGTGRFADLSVTVGQTKHLINQVVDVTWKGGTQTAPTIGSFNADYLQIMQCWGDGAEPTRENCQFGGLAGDARGGNWVSSRQVSYGSTLTDPAETYHQLPGSSAPRLVPFTSVTGVTTESASNEFFDAYSTNEIPFARTHADGTGEEHFEMLTAREAPGLGCGERLGGNRTRGCWLVIVPRDSTEVDGLPMRQRLDSSPLSASNWANRLTVPLQFDPVGISCPIGTPEQRLVGQEQVADAIARWQPVLCGATGSIFGFSQIPDDLARRQALAEDPWLSFVSNPVAPDSVSDGRKLVYAPATVDGIGLAFNIDRVPAFEAPDDTVERAGTRMGQLKLTARLVAKLLTQSYVGASLAPAKLGSNPDGLAQDPEFQALNPDFAHLNIRGLASITVPAGQGDAYAELWRWVASDPDAREFIAGKPDPWGMSINPANKGLSLDRSDFPISDLDCKTFGDGAPDLCPLDYLAYAQDLHDGGRAAGRGSTLSRSTYSADSTGGYKANPPQLSGNRAVLALTTTEIAARYSLPMASLETSTGVFVSPDQESLTAGLAAMTPSDVEGVLSANQNPDAESAYPITHITYAVTSPANLTASEATAYARFLRFVAKDGQTRGLAEGQLPPGYLPLTPALRKQTLAAADQVAARGGKPASPTPTATPTPTTTSGPTPTQQPGASVPPGAGLPSAGAATAPPTPTTTPQAAIAAASFTTPATPVGPGRFVVVTLLVAAAALIGARPLVSRRLSRRDVA